MNQVIFTLDKICNPNIMTLAQAILEDFVYKLTLGYNEKNGQGRKFSHEFKEFYQKLIRLSTPRNLPVNQKS